MFILARIKVMYVKPKNKKIYFIFFRFQLFYFTQLSLI